MAAAATKLKARKKKRVSKHVIQATERRDAETEAAKRELGPDAPLPGTSPPKPQKSKKNRHKKDPSEVAAYLSAWKHREAGGGWKFNKNTQSWLIRHMYDSNKVPKSSFVLLLEYLAGMPAGTGRDRVVEDAKRRAQRYQAFENEQEGRGGGQEKDGSTCTKTPKQDSKEGDDGKDDGMDDETRWNSLSAHDKRKEYKRARNIVEKLQQSS